ncbi:oligomeric, coiled-coil, peripheral membrane protein [Elasticomyces elasticus]|uniref:Autophagy-related protein 11 n=1 Tax=Exophiala sideris TaxID=1016849 RepID=A0ABR0JKG5_9EURO|nr:oligomeric, coiled-coil, peripheral membrane protein [Elasticomyces elasticus]KAK5035447.1 oligomeric, coiled-coil, peripheral membrane protein [Exophiala sideris]KAK5039202.1 oligomeric, coiled-coil, peripheral membrane protein [Exophiala sideris]KAK5066372.1 oligomeric, coiled-coil, peripheral membrane protein [Exophiala sideris]KAK5187049.1 oligomeric, coiled-coil, peripheral membrane protein [Eurotiomycetes sp. CCFEE 6388]
MALQVYISHTGRVLTYHDTDTTVESLRSWIESNAAIPAAHQILMTCRGKLVKSLSNEAEIYVYDKNFLSSESQPPISRDVEVQNPSDPPSSLADENSLKAWQDLFMSRRAWALEVFEVARNGVENIETCTDEATVIARSMDVALDNLRNHVNSLQQRFDETRQWADGYLQERRDVLRDWRTCTNTLGELPVREDVARILRRPKDTGHDQSETPVGTLLELTHRDRLDAAAESVERSTSEFAKALEELHNSVESLKTDTDNAKSRSPQVPQFDTNALLDEAETLAKRISADYEDVLQMPDNPKSIVSASRKAAVHTRDLLPAFQSLIQEIVQGCKSASQGRSNVSNEWSSTLRHISSLQSRLPELLSAVSSLDFQDNDNYQLLTYVFQLPEIYGATLVEATRRSEWTEHMRSEVDALHDDLSQQTEEEQRRRKRWAASHSEFLNDELNAKDALIDLKASSPRNSWPFVSRDEVFAWTDDLRALGMDDAVQAIIHRMKELDTAVRRQKPKPFKNGSMHDLTQSGVLRGADEVKSLQDDKLRLEEKLRASDSRVRKLEDLLHRQSQLSRPASGVFVPGSAADFETQSPSPSLLQRPSDHSRRSSASGRRLSNNHDEKSLVQKIVALEGQIQKLQEEAHEERRSSTESRDKMQEAELVKRDLMANLEAQKQEFDDERQLLDDEVHRLKVKLDEAEDELDRLNESRDHLRSEQDQLVVNLRNELEELRQSSDEASAQFQRRVEAAQKDAASQRERAATLERQVHQIKDERATAQGHNMAQANQLRAMEDQEQEYIAILQVVHSNLSPAGSPPENLRRLVNALEILSEGASIHARGLDDSLQLATAEIKSLEEKGFNAESQIKALTGQLSSAETRASDLREDLSQERNKASALRSELAGERAEMHSLREKFAAGETGSDALRQQLKSEEQKVAELTDRKANDEGLIQRLKHEIQDLSHEAQMATERQEKVKNHFDQRGEKSKQLSERLFHYHDRIIRMLEQFGYSISRQEENLLIQRASKVNASTLLSGGEGSGPSAMRRTSSGAAPTQHYSDPSDLDTLYWMSDSDLGSESTKFTGFVSALQRLDIDSTIDLITKRYKDVEMLAKKYQKDSRAYRERTHRSQAEAHDKIAYRSFKEGDLALFLPTRNQATRPWAAFNVGAPHYFLREQDAHKLQTRDWLLARINKVEERVVDLSRSLSTGMRGNASTSGNADDGGSMRSIDDENPFELSDGLRWYMIDASEEKLGAPGTPSVGKSTVTASNIDVKGHMGMGRKEHKSGISIGGTSGIATATMVTKTLTKSLDSRRSSTGSKKSMDLKSKHDAASTGRGSGMKDAPAKAAPLAPITSDTDAEQAQNMAEEDDSNGDADNENEATGHGARSSVVRQPTEASQTDREDAKVFEVPSNAASFPNEDATLDSTGQYPALNAYVQPGTMKPIPNTSATPSRDASQSPLRHKMPGSAASPAKSNPSPAKQRPWDKLFSVEYRA